MSGSTLAAIGARDRALRGRARFPLPWERHELLGSRPSTGRDRDHASYDGKALDARAVYDHRDQGVVNARSLWPAPVAWKK